MANMFSIFLIQFMIDCFHLFWSLFMFWR